MRSTPTRPSSHGPEPGDHLIVADALAEEVRNVAQVASWTRLETVDPSGMVCAHPLAALDAGYAFAVPLLAGDHVTEDAGTGFVHTAPGHGADDYAVWLAHGHREIPETVDADGAYFPEVPLFGGMKVLETEGKKAGKFGPANNAVIEKLIEAGNLLARGRLEHSYPHSWRSRAPVIFRNTPQWFIRMDAPLNDNLHGGRTLRETALEAIEATAFYPDAGRNRIRSMVETRPDWLISRQRAWGSPLAMFVDKASGQPLQDADVNARIVDLIAAEGADAWFTRPATDFLGDHDPDRYEKVEDILDVWFDSGSTHAFVLEARAAQNASHWDDGSPRQGPDTRWPADLYLEGSDQHRGWFQSSLLEACGTRGRAPYDQVLTHGFTVTETGEKMSKSLGNAVDPADVIRQSGAEILRLWVAMIDYSEDTRIGPSILQSTIDGYRKLRNTVRYLLGALEGFRDAERVELADMPPLERFILHRLWQLDGEVRAAYETYRFQDVWRPLADFCSNDLSALYFDICKDVLYCDRPDSLRRRACRTVLDLVFERLDRLARAAGAPSPWREAWETRFADAGVRTRCGWIPRDPRRLAQRGRGGALGAGAGRYARRHQRALEIERRDKRIGAALEVRPAKGLDRRSGPDRGLLEGLDAAEVFRTSQAILVAGDGPAGAFRLDDVAGVAVEPLRAEGRKCARSWRILPEVGADPRYPDLSLRDADAVAWWDAQHGR